jgi:hypothetical protein
MTTIDNLLLEIVTAHKKYIETNVSKRDFDILQSLAFSVNTTTFITENQSKLLVKILQENAKKLPDLSEHILTTIVQPSWSKPFRKVEQVKKFYITAKNVDDPELAIEFSFNSQLRKILTQLSDKIENLVADSNGKMYRADLTEHNIIALVELLEPLGFEIPENIQNHYNTIKSWSETEVHDQFLLTNIEHQTFHKQIIADLGETTPIDNNVINDRSMRYQYFVENPKNSGENLVEYIANRSKTKVWIDKNQHSLEEVFASLVTLKRLPVMVIFENTTDQKFHENLENLAESMKKSGIDNGVGIYFRLSNSEEGKMFNQLISSNKYNQYLDKTIKVAGVQSGKIPKFFLKNAWQPMSIISLDTKMGMRHGKTAVYANCCDLIIEWADAPNLLEQKIIIKWP